MLTQKFEEKLSVIVFHKKRQWLNFYLHSEKQNIAPIAFLRLVRLFKIVQEIIV